jgi:hypothetical protein
MLLKGYTTTGALQSPCNRTQNARISPIRCIRLES